MGLLQPEMGLLFWMCLAFGIVLFVLCKWGFPVIVKSLEERRNYIDSSIEAAKEAEEKLKKITETSQALIESAEAQKQQILRDIAKERERIVSEAKEKAEMEGARIISEAKRAAEVEREDILREARSQISTIAIAICERLLRGELADRDRQKKLAEHLLDELENDNTRN